MFSLITATDLAVLSTVVEVYPDRMLSREDVGVELDVDEPPRRSMLERASDMISRFGRAYGRVLSIGLSIACPKVAAIVRCVRSMHVARGRRHVARVSGCKRYQRSVIPAKRAPAAAQSERDWSRGCWAALGAGK